MARHPAVSIVYLAANDMDRHDAQRRHVWEFCTALVGQSEIRRLTLITPTRELGEDLGDRFEHLSVYTRRSPVRLLLRECRILRCLRRRSREDRIDVIYMRNGRFSLGGSVFAALSGTPLVLEVNGAASEEYRLTTTAPGIVSFFVRMLLDAVFKFNCLRCEKIIAVTEGLRDHVIQRCGIPHQRVRVFPNGVNTSTFVPMDMDTSKTKVGLSQHLDYIGFVGSLAPWEGVDCLIKAFALARPLLPNHHLAIVGDGLEKAKLVQLSQQLGLADRIIFVGRVKHELVPWFVNSCDFLVYSAIHNRPSVADVSPLKTPEYLACGKPVVASRLPGLEFIDRERLGFTFNPGDAEDMARALLQAAHLTIAEASAIGRNARDIADDRYSWTKLVRGILQFVLDDDRYGRTPTS